MSIAARIASGVCATFNDGNRLSAGIAVDHRPQGVVVAVSTTRLGMEGKLDALSANMVHAVLETASGTEDHQAGTRSRLAGAGDHVADVGGAPAAATRGSGAVDDSSRTDAVRSVVGGEDVGSVICNQRGLTRALEAASAIAVVLTEGFLFREAVGRAVGRVVNADGDGVAGTDVH